MGNPNKLGTAVGAMMLGSLAAGGAVAEEKTQPIILASATSEEVTAATHCPTYAKMGNTRANKKARLLYCVDQQDQLKTAALDTSISSLDDKIAELQSYITEQGLALEKLRTLNDNGEKLAQIVEENGRLRLEIKALEESQQATLQRIDEFLASRQGQ